MSLSELFKPWLGSCGACAAPWPNVALVLQYLQALRVSLTLSKKKKEKIMKRIYGCCVFMKLVFFLRKVVFWNAALEWGAAFAAIV